MVLALVTHLAPGGAAGIQGGWVLSSFTACLPCCSFFLVATLGMCFLVGFLPGSSESPWRKVSGGGQLLRDGSEALRDPSGGF